MWQRRRTDVLKLSHTHSPTQIFQNALCVVRWYKQMSLQSSQSTWSPGFSPKPGKEADFTVSSLSVINLWPCISVGSCSGGLALWCFLGSSWVVWGQKMCALKSRCYRYCQIDLLKCFLAFFGGGVGRLKFLFGGATEPRPPAPPPAIDRRSTLKLERCSSCSPCVYRQQQQQQW